MRLELYTGERGYFTGNISGKSNKETIFGEENSKEIEIGNEIREKHEKAIDQETKTWSLQKRIKRNKVEKGKAEKEKENVLPKDKLKVMGNKDR